MKRFSVSLISTLLAFLAGLVTAAPWNSNSKTVTIEPVGVNVLERCPPSQPQVVTATQPSTIVSAAAPEFDFAQGHLKLVAERVQLKSESLLYDIDVRYPQIVGGDDSHIFKVNQQIKELATQKYQWPLNPSKTDLANTRQNYPGIFNTVSYSYEIGLATDSLLSVNLTGYSYGAGAANPVGESSYLNYDLTSGKQLKLSDIFKPGSNYLELISRHCVDQLWTGGDVTKALAPRAENFESWHITSNGINFNFDACKVLDCAVGDLTVHIPFSDLTEFLKPGIPGKFKITYP